MNIVVLADSIATQKTGIHRYGIQLVENLASQDDSMRLTLVCSRYLPQFKVPQLIVPVYRFIPLHLRIRQLCQLGRKVAKLKPDVVIELAHFGPFGLPASIQRVTVVHDITPITFPQYHDRASVMFHRYLFPAVIKKSDLIIANSKTTKTDLIRKLLISEEKIHVVYPSLPPLDNLDGGKHPAPRIRPYFLTVGTLEPRKNHRCIIRAFEIFSESFPDYDLVMVGKKGWKTKSLHQTIARSPVRNKLILTDYISSPELQMLYRDTHAFVFASHYEGLGLPVLEAMQAGAPLALSRISSSQELVNEDEALWFLPNDPSQLASHLTSLVAKSGLKDSLAQKSRNAYRDYEKKIAQQDLLSLMKKLIGTKPW